MSRLASSLLLLVLGTLPACHGSPPETPRAPASAAPAAASTPASQAPTAPPTESPQTRWENLKASEAACADCHPEQSDAWYATKMGRSLLTIDPKTHAPFRRPARLTHPLTGLEYTQSQGRFTEKAGPGLEVAREAKYIIGSGNHAHSYLWATDDQLFQMPVTWFTDRKAWDFSPGYEAMMDHPGFFREVSIDCLNCHTDPVPTRAGTRSRFEALPEGPIGCSRCHGDARAHAEARLNGKDAAVVVPTRLTPARAADVCAVCHFGGATRVLRDGKQWTDFLPGDDLSNTAAIFVRQQAGEGYSTTDHFSRLGMSKCTQKTPTLTCATCHAPHVAKPSAKNDRSEPCRVCHGEGGRAEAHPCKGPMGPDCAGCHMDTGPARNIPHVTAVDHFIRTRPTPAPALNNDSPLVWVTHPEPEPTDPDRQILLGRAYVAVWRADRQPKDAERAEQWLTRGLKALPQRTDAWIELATLRRLTGNAAGEAEAAERAYALDPAQRRVATVVGAARIAAGRPDEALTALDRAAALSPRAETETLRARALQMLGRTGQALEAARKATMLQPSYAEGFIALGMLAHGEKRYDEAFTALNAATAWRPKDLRGWLHLGAVEAARKHPKESLAAFDTALSLAGQDTKARSLAVYGRAEALVALGKHSEAFPLLEDLFRSGVRLPGMPRTMGRVYLVQGNFVEARGALEAAVKISPDDAELWDWLAEARQELGMVAEAATAKAQASTLRAQSPRKTP
jgi:tetratricopeptide (TPR) repeat protein